MFKKKKFWIIVTAIVLVVATLCLVGCNVAKDVLPEGDKDEASESAKPSVTPTSTSAAANGQQTVLVNNALNMEEHVSEGLMLLAAPTVTNDNLVAGVTDQYVTYIINAVITPSTATNKLVDWDISWEDESRGDDDIETYLQLSINSDGSTRAAVTCLQPFEGNAVITCVTRDGGYMAECIVSFVGKPTEIVVSSTATFSDNAYRLGTNTSYTFDVDLTNPYGQVGSQFNNVTVSVTGVGRIKVGTATYSGGTYKFDESTLHDIAINDILSNFVISYNYANGTLTLQTNKAIEAYVGKVQSASGTRFYTDKFHSFVDDCYFNITFTEQTSGITKTVKAYFDQSVVTGVSIDNYTLQF